MYKLIKRGDLRLGKALRLFRQDAWKSFAAVQSTNQEAAIGEQKRQDQVVEGERKEQQQESYWCSRSAVQPPFRS